MNTDAIPTAVDEYTTSEAVVRNAVSDSALPALYGQLAGAD